jgi:hypothetical protein
MDEHQRYFPVGAFSAGRADDNFLDRWYTDRFRALEEPSLLTTACGDSETVYRFTWLRTRHHPIAVRITVRANGTGTLTSKMTDGAAGYWSGKLIANATRDVDATEIQHVLELIDAMGFWQMLARDEVEGMDGAQWILEGCSHGTYHVIHRWSPTKGLLRELGLYLVLTLSKFDCPAEVIY